MKTLTQVLLVDEQPDRRWFYARGVGRGQAMKTDGGRFARDPRYFDVRESPLSFVTTHWTEEFWIGSVSR
jgi:hypothetical protein